PRPIFPRIDLAKVRAEAAKKAEAKAEAGKEAQGEAEGKGKAKAEAGAAESGLVSFEEFSRLDLRIGKVVSAEPVKGADKLLKLMVDVGEGEPRQVVAGLAPYFGPEDLVGKSIVLVANLEPATIRGVESRGMLLAAGEKEPLALLVPDRDCPPGTKVR
ncbi:MAG: methionine--tRNA ligase subunit beta, partial [Armatimonadetes bacterium]|nr:methionine--tRNA ligase subunit beta [Armatimonadota bacterium]